MIKKQPVLVPVDFSAHSEAALLWAAENAGGAPILVLHVVHDPESYARANESDHLRSMEEIAQQLLAEFLERVRSEHSTLPALDHAQTILVAGLPATRILEVAELEGAKQIVMGSQGRTGLAQLLLGSKANRVVQLAKIPVTIVKAPE
ncbi:MAG: universal stress protein [Planctomycetota bacterium]